MLDNHVEKVPSLKSPESFEHVSLSRDLARIKRTHLNLVTQKRSTNNAIQSYLQNCRSLGPQNFDLEVIQGQEERLEQLGVQLPNVPELAGKELLVQDMIELTKLFFSIYPVPKADVSLAFINYNMCRLFHTDKIAIRLLTTYFGKATEWLPNSNANRSALGKGCNSNIVIEDNNIQRMQEFEVGLLKGDAHPKNPGSGIVHRSPTVEGTLEPFRVLFKIDEHLD